MVSRVVLLLRCDKYGFGDASTTQEQRGGGKELLARPPYLFFPSMDPPLTPLRPEPF